MERLTKHMVLHWWRLCGANKICVFWPSLLVHKRTNKDCGLKHGQTRSDNDGKRNKSQKWQQKRASKMANNVAKPCMNYPTSSALHQTERLPGVGELQSELDSARRAPKAGQAPSIEVATCGYGRGSEGSKRIEPPPVTAAVALIWAPLVQARVQREAVRPVGHGAAAGVIEPRQGASAREPLCGGVRVGAPIR